MSSDHPPRFAQFEPLRGYVERTAPEITARAAAFTEQLSQRRSVRDFADRDVPREALELALKAACSAPSGANLQPWRFVVVTDAAVKRQIRLAAEEEERAFYNGRAPQEWLDALAPLGTDADKGFLERATLVAVFAERYGCLPDGRRVKHYYVPESVGLACGFLIAALHHAGLATLTHTPSPMAFLNQICGRPENEKPYLLLAVGYPAEGAQVPVFAGVRKPMAEAVSWIGVEAVEGDA
ncbi:MAG: nitroreductase family protein [Rhodobacteraceae bacterium]|nr:nitroreductase family protein [Paracoccaceae bacterium]